MDGFMISPESPPRSAASGGCRTSARQGRRRGGRRAWLAATVALALPVHAVIIASGDGTGNTEPPPDDPGFRNVGRSALTVVYLGNGWVITANHSGPAEVFLDGGRHKPIAGSWTRLAPNPSPAEPETLPPDLAVYKVRPTPDLPSLPIRRVSPRVGAEVILVGMGRDRGPAVTWGEHSGFTRGETRSLRWGTNRVLATGQETRVGLGDSTLSFSMDFSSVSPTAHEAQVVLGDSGGAAFIRREDEPEGGWELAGILFARSGYANQPTRLALFGNITFCADLSVYRDQILALISKPACSDGLDDDADGHVDHPADPDCEGPEDTSEDPG